MPLDPGTRLGPYHILDPLGAGGMGEVYRARDTRLDRTVAIKIIPPHLAGSIEFRSRFEREAKAISALSHPNICVLHDIGHQDGVDFLVMEYLEGDTLAQRLKRGPLPVDVALRYGADIAEALASAHRRRIVHRDLKPGNVMITKAGVKLLDFGLAKRLPQDVHSAGVSGFSDLPTGDGPLTIAGSLVGTVAYMAPEQLQGMEPDARTDVFALGTVLYEMLTGRRAFSGRTQADLVASILSSTPVPVSTARPTASQAIDHAVAGCLAKDPDARWQCAQDLAVVLRRMKDPGSATDDRMAGAMGHGAERLVWTAAAAVAGLLGLLVGTTLTREPRKRSNAPQVRFEVTAPDSTRFGDWTIALSPDGSRLVFTASAEGKSHLYHRNLASLNSTRIPDSEDGYNPFWAPDGMQIAFAVGGIIKKTDLAGSPPQTLCGFDGLFLGGSWGSDGTILLAIDNDLMSLPAQGGEPRRLGVREHGELHRSWPQFLPDGRGYLYLSTNVDSEMSGIYAARLGQDGRKRIIGTDYNAAFAPSGHLLSVRGDALVAQPLDLARLEPSGETFRIDVLPALYHYGQAPRVRSFSEAVFSLSANGVLAWRSGLYMATTTLTWFDRNGRALGTLGEPGGYSNPALSPDGSRLSVDEEDARTHVRDIRVFDLARGGQLKLTHEPADDFGAVWSPDGSRLAFNSNRTGNRAIYVKQSSGLGDDELLVENTERSTHVEDWSPDGRFLALNQMSPTHPSDVFFRVMADPSSASHALTGILTTPSWEDMSQFSPDGRLIAYRSNESGRSEVYVREINADGSAGSRRWPLSTNGGVEPRWARDGKELFYLSGPVAQTTQSEQGTLMVVTVTARGGTFEAGRPRALFDIRLPAMRRHRYVVMPDGQKFLINRVHQEIEETISPIQVLVNWLPEAITASR